MKDQESISLVSALPMAQRRPAAPLRSKVTRSALSLCLGLLVTGCGPSLETKAENIAQKSKPMVASGEPISNPMLNHDYSADADVPFVTEPITSPSPLSGQIDFGSESASRRTRDMAVWVLGSKDNRNMPFAIVDKINAKVYVFSGDGKLYGAAPVLLGRFPPIWP